VSAGAGEARAQLEAIFRAGLGAVDPAVALSRAAAPRRDGLWLAGELLPRGSRCGVLAVGKAAPAMAAAFEEAAASLALRGLVVARDGGGPRPARLERREAGHPLPDERSADAGRAALALAAQAGPDEALVVLLSGGASALLATPLPGLELGELRATTELLLRSGAAIGELNCVRKHLTAASGGRLAAATRARRVFVLLISDVLGDDPATIGSGPCAPDATSHRDALAVLERRALLARVPAAVRRQLEEGAAGRRPESPKPGDPAFAPVRHILLASNRDALAAARADARARGLEARIVSEALRGEARELGVRLAALARAAAGGPRALLLLAGGEPTVTVRGAGRGGRAQELALAAALALEGEARVALLAAGTDGSDGPTAAAGAFADGGTVARGAAAGLDARACLDANDSHGFFVREGGCFVTGPTGTNVMDLVLVRVERAP
jgi:glycerate-2-kinase